MTTELQAAAVELQQGQSLELIDCVSKMHMSVMCLGCELPSDVHRDVIILWLKVRAHIAAQSSEIEALKHDMSSYIEASSELATDNERLRDAIIQYVICCPADRDTTNDFLKASYKLDEALAEGAKNDNI